MYGTLSDFINWLNSVILSISDSIKILMKSLFLNIFSWYLSLFSVLKKWGQFQQQKSPWCYDVTPLTLFLLKM